MFEAIAGFIIHLIQTTQYTGIFILMTLESALIPIPSEVTMPFSGFLVASGKLSFWEVVLTGTVANLTGSLISYYIGYFLEETVLVTIIKRYGKVILVTNDDYEHARKWFIKYGDKVIFISRLLPGIRTIISLPAGAFKMNIKKFTFYTILGCFLWSTFLTYIGLVLGKNWNSLEKYFRQFQIIIAFILILGIIYYVEKKIHVIGKFKNRA